jgi:hypothetical protein
MRRRCPAGRQLAALAGSLTLAGTLAAMTGAGPADAAVMACQTWTATQPPPLGTDDALNGVAVPSATDAWAVGSTSGNGSTGAHALIEHWNGSAWTTVPANIPRESSLFSVRSAAPASIWAVGTVQNAKDQERTLILHWNGKAWAQQPSPNPGSLFDALDGVRVVSATNAWAVGDYSNGGGVIRSLILHWNGTVWKQMSSPNPAGDNDLAAVAATSAVSAWAVGLAGSVVNAPAQPSPATAGTLRADPQSFIVHWNGKAWTRQPSPSPGAFDDLAAVGATSATNAWAVGSTGPAGLEQTLILHWNGRTWRRLPSPDPDGSNNDNFLTGVTATSAGNAWAVGQSVAGGFILQWDGHRWHEVLALLPGTNQSSLSGVAASSADNAWAVGEDIDGTTAQPLALHCT